jgi:hypothetical protein
LWREFPPRHPFQAESSRSLDAYEALTSVGFSGEIQGGGVEGLPLIRC